MQKCRSRKFVALKRWNLWWGGDQNFIPRNPFSILEPQDQEIREFYVVQERRATNFEAPKLWKGSSGSRYMYESTPCRDGKIRVVWKSRMVEWNSWAPRLKCQKENMSLLIIFQGNKLKITYSQAIQVYTHSNIQLRAEPEIRQQRSSLNILHVVINCLVSQQIILLVFLHC